MSSRGPIRRPSASTARRLPLTLAVIGTAGLGLGLLLARASLGVPHPMSRDDAISRPQAPAAASARAPEPEPDNPSGAPQTPPVASAEPVPEPLPAPADAPAPTPLSLFPGRLAYTQCVGIERPGTAYPCPRDRPLEAAAWRILMSLPECAEPALGPGSADIRLRFTGDAPPEILIRPLRGQDPLNADDLLACAGDRLAGLRTRLQSRRLVLSIRLKLQ